MTDDFPVVPQRPVDIHGCPVTMNSDGSSAIHAPERPCRYCTGNSEVNHQSEDRKLTSWEWCQEFGTCAATVDWEKVFNQG